jgi:hypothetical protein
MLTKESFTAINHFVPLIHKMTGNLKLLYDHLDKFKPSFNKVSDKITQKKVTLGSLDSERFIDGHLKKDITKLTQCRTVIFKTYITTFTLEIHYTNEYLDPFLNTLMYTLAFVTMLAPHKVRNIHMKYYLLDVKRVLDGDTYFDKEEVNGGACSSSPNECSITIWRKEEILKVSIHEMIHGLHYDYKQDSSDIVKHYQNKYGITSPKMNTFEAYTEIWAELLHCFIISCLSDKHSYDLFCANVGIEMEFSHYQSSKVLLLLDKDKHVNKETNVTAYYIIKTELYANLQTFIDYCIKANKDIVKIIDTSKYLEYLKGFKKVSKKKYNINSNYLKNTTRMTCLEMDLL